MKILNNILSPEEIDQFRKFWTDQAHRVYVNWEDEDGIVDHRLPVTAADPEWSIIQRIVEAVFPGHGRIWSALQRQNRAHNIHIDDFSTESPHPTYTYVIAFDTVPEFRTIVWQERCADNDALFKYLDAWNPETDQKISNISEVEDLEHTLDPNKNAYLADYLTLDGIFSYQAGSAVLFETIQLHCTSNWRKYSQHNVRELLQIHVTVPPA
jgi:hypothetical protein